MLLLVSVPIVALGEWRSEGSDLLLTCNYEDQTGTVVFIHPGYCYLSILVVLAVLVSFPGYGNPNPECGSSDVSIHLSTSLSYQQ